MTREKEFKTIHEQIIIQKNRNLKIPDELQMESFIQQKNYFNSINGFETLFLLTSNPKKYMSRVSFKDIKRIYVLDRILLNTYFKKLKRLRLN